MHELGMKLRLSTRVAMKIILTRARGVCLKSDHLACLPFQAAVLCKGSSWMTHAQQAAETLGGTRVFFCEDRESMRLLEFAQSDAARRAVRERRNSVVLPQLARVEKEWFQTQASKWSSRHCFSLVPWDARHLRFLHFLQSL